MTRDEVRALGRGLAKLHARFASCFGRKEAQGHALVYLKGLVLGEGRKNVERMALRFGAAGDSSPAAAKEVVALQEFLTRSPWEASQVMREIQTAFAEQFVPSTREWPLGTVGVLDETAVAKAGSESCGVKPQYCGSLAKTANCQVGVYLLGVAPVGAALLDCQLYLPQEWARDRQRRKKTRVPAGVRFQTKTQIALSLVNRTLAAGQVAFDWLTADALYGHDGDFLSALDKLQQRYVMAVAPPTRVWPKKFTAELPPWAWEPKPTFAETKAAAKTVQQIAAQLPAAVWRIVNVRDGAAGPVAFQFARCRAWAIRAGKPGPPVWLLIRRSLGKDPEYKYYLSNADEATPLETLALVASTRQQIEQFFEEAKGSLGLADYEARSWTSWHHHMSLVALAHLFLVQTRRELRASEPALTLPLALELVRAALDRPQLSEEDAIRLTEYHLQRNATARASHHKSWLQKHKAKIPKPLL
jgi:SRSO17 transposase